MPTRAARCDHAPRDGTRILVPRCDCRRASRWADRWAKRGRIGRASRYPVLAVLTRSRSCGRCSLAAPPQAPRLTREVAGSKPLRRTAACASASRAPRAPPARAPWHDRGADERRVGSAGSPPWLRRDLPHRVEALGVEVYDRLEAALQALDKLTATRLPSPAPVAAPPANSQPAPPEARTGRKHLPPSVTSPASPSPSCPPPPASPRTCSTGSSGRCPSAALVVRVDGADGAIGVSRGPREFIAGRPGRPSGSLGWTRGAVCLVSVRPDETATGGC